MTQDDLWTSVTFACPLYPIFLLSILQEEKKSFKERLQAAQEICLQVQEGLDVVASLGERVKK